MKNTRILIKKIFPGISDFCKKCDTCCYTYGWLSKGEARKFIEIGYSVAQINRSLYCIDSFVRDQKGNIKFEKIPRCIFYKNKKCSIYKEKPLDCDLYPIKIRISNNRVYVGVSLGCKYIFSLSKKKRQEIYLSVVEFFKNIPPSTLNNYLDMSYSIYLISRIKTFWFKELLEAKKKCGKWKLIDIYKK